MIYKIIYDTDRYFEILFVFLSVLKLYESFDVYDTSFEDYVFQNVI